MVEWYGRISPQLKTLCECENSIHIALSQVKAVQVFLNECPFCLIFWTNGLESTQKLALLVFLALLSVVRLEMITTNWPNSHDKICAES